jgi:hypothetical protein
MLTSSTILCIYLAIDLWCPPLFGFLFHLVLLPPPVWASIRASSLEPQAYRYRGKADPFP